MNCLEQVVLVYFVTGVVWTKWWPRYCFAPVHSFYLFLLFSLTVSRNTQLSWTLTKLVRTPPQCVHCPLCPGERRDSDPNHIMRKARLGLIQWYTLHWHRPLGRGGGGSNLTVGFVRSRVNGVTPDHNSWGKFGRAPPGQVHHHIIRAARVVTGAGVRVSASLCNPVVVVLCCQRSIGFHNHWEGPY